MVYRFGEVELDELRHELRRRGEPVAIEPKVFELLRLLVRHRDRVLGRDLLQRALWPDTVVSGNSLSRLVKEARRAIGDRGDRQDLIRTVRRVGYRFVGAVESCGPQTDRSEADRLISSARACLEAAIATGRSDLHLELDQFVRTCQVAVEFLAEGRS